MLHATPTFGFADRYRVEGTLASCCVYFESLGALREFAEWLYATHGPKINRLSAVPFASADALLEMLAWPLASL